MSVEILNSEEITKEMAMNELYNSTLSQDEKDEYLDIISAINDGQVVYNIETDQGDYLFFIKGETIKDTKKKL